ncbi:MAG: U32 family peptidase [Tannerella sp.]|jgi:putative protease|nr:U32 family peptidase [Tannerella sp.]
MSIARPVELCAPAKDLTCGIEAVRHGADAVYIGAPMFGARAAAGNPVDDIRRLCDYAHLFNVRVYIAFNTILKDSELQEAEDLIHQLYEVGADALIIQDMGITQMNLPPVPLHASTQADNCTPEKIAFLHRAGFSQVVLARELSLFEIQTIARRTPIRLEAFVHGSLCVSYSGRCYLSAAVSGRSANRGECAQNCRLPYSLVDANGRTIVADKHLLSLNDLNLTDELESMMESGISSFKIEGRLKEMDYVKNITAWYRQKLDAVFARNPRFYRPSAGQSTYTFTPQPDKSFNRGFTSYFLHGRTPEITSYDTPKSIGEQMGVVKEVKGNSFTLAGLKQVHNGDGLAFFNVRGELEGFRVNRVEANRIFPLQMPVLRPNTVIYRNFDKSFEDVLSKSSAERKLSVKMELSDSDTGIALTITDEIGLHAVATKPCAHEKAKSDQTENIRTQLSKLGNTPFRADEIVISLSEPWFIPSSLLGELRRDAVESLLQVRRASYRREEPKKITVALPDIGYPVKTDTDIDYQMQKDADNVYPAQKNANFAYPAKHLDYTANIANQKARAFYRLHGVESMEDAFEIIPQKAVPLMFTKHCIRYGMGWCPRYHKQKSPFEEPFFLIHNQTKLQLRFDCENCVMQVLDTATEK